MKSTKGSRKKDHRDGLKSSPKRHQRVFERPVIRDGSEEGKAQDAKSWLLACCQEAEADDLEVLRYFDSAAVIKKRELRLYGFTNDETLSIILGLYTYRALIGTNTSGGSYKTNIFAKAIREHVENEDAMLIEGDYEPTSIDGQRMMTPAKLAQEAYHADKHFPEWTLSQLKGPLTQRTHTEDELQSHIAALNAHLQNVCDSAKAPKEYTKKISRIRSECWQKLKELYREKYPNETELQRLNRETGLTAEWEAEALRKRETGPTEESVTVPQSMVDSTSEQEST